MLITCARNTSKEGFDLNTCIQGRAGSVQLIICQGKTHSSKTGKQRQQVLRSNPKTREQKTEAQKNRQEGTKAHQGT